MILRRIRMLLAVAALGALAVCVGPAQSAFPGTNGKIVLASDRDGELDVYSMEPDGSTETRLTNTPGDDAYPMWSSDGTMIVFSSRREGVNKIFTMNAAGTAAPTRVTDPTTTVSGQGDEEPSWSRNGSRIAFRSDRELGFAHIWTVNADGTGLVRLTSVGENLNPVWSPTTDLIAFTSDRDADGDYELFTMDALGGNIVQRTSNTYWDSNPDWSPDGTRLAFQSFLDGQFEIQVLHLASGTLSRLTNDPGFDTAPAWSPDGAKIVFQSNRDGDFEIFTMSADGTGAQQLTNNSASDRVADWQPLVGPGDTTPPTMVPARVRHRRCDLAGRRRRDLRRVSQRRRRPQPDRVVLPRFRGDLRDRHHDRLLHSNRPSRKQHQRLVSGHSARSRRADPAAPERNPDGSRGAAQSEGLPGGQAPSCSSPFRPESPAAAARSVHRAGSVQSVAVGLAGDPGAPRRQVARGCPTDQIGPRVLNQLATGKGNPP